MTEVDDRHETPSLRGDLLPAYFQILTTVDGLPATISTRPAGWFRPPSMPGLRPLVRHIVAAHLRRNVELLSRWFNAQAATSVADTGGPPELAALDHAHQALPPSRWPPLLLAAAAIGAAASIALSAVLPDPVRALVGRVWFDLLKLDASGVAAALPLLDGDSGTGITDVFYLVVAISVIGTAVLAPLIIARGSYRVADALLHGRDPTDRSALVGACRAPRTAVIDIERRYSTSLGAPSAGLVPGDLLPSLIIAPLLIVAVLLAVAALSFSDAGTDIVLGYREGRGWAVIGPVPAHELIETVLYLSVPILILLDALVRRTRNVARQWQARLHGRDTDTGRPHLHPVVIMWRIACFTMLVPGVGLISSAASAVWSFVAVIGGTRTDARAIGRRLLWRSLVLTAVNITLFLLAVVPDQ